MSVFIKDISKAHLAFNYKTLMCNVITNNEFI